MLSLSASQEATRVQEATVVTMDAVHVVMTTVAHAAMTEVQEVHVVSSATTLLQQSRTTSQRCSNRTLQITEKWIPYRSPLFYWINIRM